jgi:signal transduction histidine kinase
MHISPRELPVRIRFILAFALLAEVGIAMVTGHGTGDWRGAAAGAGVALCALLALAGAMSAMARELKRLSQAQPDEFETLLRERLGPLERSRDMFKLMAESTRGIPFTLDLGAGSFIYFGGLGVAETGIAESEWLARGALDTLIPRDTNGEVRQRFDACDNGPFEFVTTLVLRDARRREIRWTGTCERHGHTALLRGMMVDITEFRRQGRELAAAQKLESVGRLAAGVAHEINTPVQFVTDNVTFVKDAVQDLTGVIAAYQEFKNAVSAGGDPGPAARRAEAAEQSADLNYVLQEVPSAIQGSIEGLNRIATIVRSMKAFAHPDQAQKTMADINQAILSTLVIAGNEYKYVATVETDLGDLPLVQCYLGEINQVVLNLIVNAAHAIADVFKVTGVLGKITIRTRLVGSHAEISVTDTGTGIPEAARAKLFDPFFTTKEVGKGTGQGLAIARSVVVNKHSGVLDFDTEMGKGSTFYIRIPVAAPDGSAVESAVAA